MVAIPFQSGLCFLRIYIHRKVRNELSKVAIPFQSGLCFLRGSKPPIRAAQFFVCRNRVSASYNIPPDGRTKTIHAGRNPLSIGSLLPT